MSQPDDITTLAQRLEANEVDAWRAIVQGPPAAMAQQLGLGWAEQGGALLIWNRAAPVPIYNRLLALGVFEPATDALLDTLLARGLRQNPAWLMHFHALRGELPAPDPPPGYRIERVTPESAPAWSDAILAGWEVPQWAATGVLATLLPLAQHPAWACYLAIYEPTGLVVGGGALFVAHGVGGLYTDGVRAEHRGRALQRPLIAARIAEAQRRGCELACAQTYVASAGQRNMASLGFEVAYTRLNYVMPK